MKEAKYRLGNQPEEYVLREDYLGWAPENKSWMQLCANGINKTEFTIANPKDAEKKVLFLHCIIFKSAFPLYFFGEKRAIDWTHFAIVSNNETSEKFIIPLH